MVAASHTDRMPRVAAARVGRRWRRTTRRLRYSEASLVTAMAVATALIGFGMFTWPNAVPVTSVLVPLVIANLVVSPRALPWFVVYSLGVVVVASTAEDALMDDRRIGGIVIAFLVGLVILVSSFRRSRLGVAGSLGESMLIDLRDRISKQSQIPRLPDGWYSEAVMRSAGGSSFAGDFIVATTSRGGRHLEVAVVDVSGKGEQAGTRSLLLSGSFGGLLGALPADQFLASANDYLLRQDWTEGFATAIHLSLDLHTGDFELRSAGHPPAVQLNAGAGRWGVHEPEGPVLGLMERAEFTVVRGTVQRGDVLLLFTDGLVETPQRDIALGIDKLLGQGERLLRDGFENGAQRLIDRLESIHDDRALLMLHRR